MSDLAVIRAAFDNFNAREVDEFVASFAPDVVWYPLFAAIEGEVYRGHAGVRAIVANLDASWDGLQAHLDELIPLEGGALVLGRFIGTGRETGISMSTPGGWLFSLRDGLIAEVRTFGDHDEARRAAGL